MSEGGQIWPKHGVLTSIDSHPEACSAAISDEDQRERPPASAAIDSGQIPPPVKKIVTRLGNKDVWEPHDSSNC